LRIFKTKVFSQWAKSNDLNDSILKEAIQELTEGSYEADLGGYVFKKRVAREG
jgi:hypothetical protein